MNSAVSLLDTLQFRRAQYYVVSEGHADTVSLEHQPDTVTVIMPISCDIRVLADCGTVHSIGPGDVFRAKARARPFDGVQSEGPGPQRKAALLVGAFDVWGINEHPILGCLESAFALPTELAQRERWINGLRRILCEACHDGLHIDPLFLNRASELFLAELLRAELSVTGISECGVKYRDQSGVQRAIEQMRNAPATPFTLAELASISGMSRSKFAETFKQMTGKTPMGFLSDLRMELARGLLAGSQQSVQQIAAQIGYQSQHSFSRAFAQHFRTPPSAYRQTCLVEIERTADVAGRCLAAE